MMKIFLTCLPAFYKTNLYNEIAKKTDITVFYIYNIEKTRNADFFNGKKSFKYHILPNNKIVSFIYLIKFLFKQKNYELIIGGWDELLYWLIILFSPRSKNSLALESSIYESNIIRIKGLIKRLFLKRISKVYASGCSQKKILEELSYSGKTIITKGVGIFNYQPQPSFTPRDEVRNFIFVGRLIEVKNLEFIIEYFNQHPNLNLHIVGFGKLESDLKRMSNSNIHFGGAVDNKKLPAIYQSMDVFILPSKSEVWGLVVEEALNNGLPVLVSDRVGCAEEVLKSSYSRVFEYNNNKSLNCAINELLDINTYNTMRKAVSELDFEIIENKQVSCYL